MYSPPSTAATPPVRAAECKAAGATVISIAGAQQNELLRALGRDELERLFAHLELVSLPAGKHLFDFGDKIAHCYFPTNAIVALLYVMADGATTELAVIGSEGAVGVALYEAERASCSAVVQSAGYGYRLKTACMRALFHEGGTLAQLLMRHNGALFSQMAQNVVGGRHCSIEQKLCRWLLERLDRSPSNELKLTQDTMASMLGVRRESVTVAARKLQDAGLIRYRRGTVVVLDRNGLERAAGACYRAACVGLEQLRRRAAAGN
ncbi:Crp/Fnr family transcriptional regulator [Janthinobacterium fluminis]|uniref:Crp/Fnr family transcriptional regulator n=1 Tax=Janthinobacterium fluminis TaxID=2987524 RepID=A0ABT5K1K4_9BURK|nr:Crp/Fnr family transcriptional regulator [Janthinobacterium fluminis]MDC8758859.1 Crp/Fnr family transcriptional regulator [Janthinobacterium fluminis]